MASEEPTDRKDGLMDGVLDTWVQFLTVPHTSSVTLGKSLSLTCASVPQLSNGDDNFLCHRGVTKVKSANDCETLRYEGEEGHISV